MSSFWIIFILKGSIQVVCPLEMILLKKKKVPLNFFQCKVKTAIRTSASLLKKL